MVTEWNWMVTEMYLPFSQWMVTERWLNGTFQFSLNGGVSSCVDSVVLEKKIFYVNVFSLFRNYLPLEKGEALHLKKLESPSPKDTLCQVWLKLAQWSCEEVKNRKSLQTDRQTDAGQKAIRKAHLSFQLRWAKKETCCA